MTDPRYDKALTGLREMLAKSNPDMVASRRITQGVIDGIESGGMKLEEIVVLLAGAVANIERRLVSIENASSSSAPTP